ncbi:histidine phosphatase family protein [Conexibacter sp. SYSU D00693]|uniref:SixA phosphatase family protein n=1 Tax=Conexibacter sp. SYSU D00693 TaxID=2812560 RepID=UPI00196B9CD7|nr:histidine phosphatase family protein [Conexibacter sp. SYSU D00693]
MPRQLWVLRHGEAEPHDAQASDAARRLTPRGEDQARAAGRSFAALGLTFQRVFASPKVRAWETARLACEALGVEPEEHGALAGGFGGGDALGLVRETAQDDRLLLVGHNPDLPQVVADLTGGRIELKKGGAAGVRLHGPSGELIALLRPRELDRIG